MSFVHGASTSIRMLSNSIQAMRSVKGANVDSLLKSRKSSHGRLQNLRHLVLWICHLRIPGATQAVTAIAIGPSARKTAMVNLQKQSVLALSSTGMEITIYEKH
jgi:hypothetical protein